MGKSASSKAGGGGGGGGKGKSISGGGRDTYASGQPSEAAQALIDDAISKIPSGSAVSGSNLQRILVDYADRGIIPEGELYRGSQGEIIVKRGDNLLSTNKFGDVLKTTPLSSLPKTTLDNIMKAVAIQKSEKGTGTGLR